MSNIQKIGIVREGKIPPDARTPLTPEQCVAIQQQFDVEVVIQPSPIRCYTDAEYEAAGLRLQTDLSDCQVLLGIKEVPKDTLIPGKIYLFFSHTIKKQAYNRALLQTILAKNIRLIDYETLVDERGERLVAFGYYAGVVGAHNGLWAYGERTGLFSLPRMNTLKDYAAAVEVYQKTAWPLMRVVVSGSGRVAAGSVRALTDMGFRQVSPRNFLVSDADHPVFTQLRASDYTRRKDAGPDYLFDKKDFYAHGEAYKSIFAPYAKRADVFVNAIFYDKKAPRFFEQADMAQPDFKIQVVADISCDMMPDASVPCTLRPSTITDPLYGFDPHTGNLTPPHQPGTVDVMAIDNLPSELPRDASAFFGRQLVDRIFPDLLRNADESAILQRATITANGQLTERFSYLEDFVHAVPTT